MLRSLRPILLAALMAVPSTASSAGHELDRAQLREAISKGSAIPFSRLEPEVTARMRGEIVDVALYELGTLYYRVVVRRADGRMVSAVIDAKRGSFLPVSSEAAQAVQSAARGSGGGGFLGLFQPQPGQPAAASGRADPSSRPAGNAFGSSRGGGIGATGNPGNAGGNGNSAGGAGGNGGNAGGSGGGGGAGGNGGSAGGGGGSGGSGGGGGSGGSGGGGGDGGGGGSGGGGSGGSGGSSGGGGSSGAGGGGGSANAGGGASDNSGRGRN